MRTIKRYSDMLMESASLDRRLFLEVNKIVEYPLNLNASYNAIVDLLDQGADPNVGGKEGIKETPLHLLTKPGREKFLELFIERNADVNAKDKFGFTPLMNAVVHQNLNAIRILVESGANVNLPEESGRTPLHNAILHEYPSLKVVDLLLDLGANPNLETDGGTSCLKMALNLFKSRSEESYMGKRIAKLLIERGADPLKAFDGNTKAMIGFFNNDISWMPKNVQERIAKINRSKKLFGRG
jgi:hypothetical protein